MFLLPTACEYFGGVMQIGDSMRDFMIPVTNFTFLENPWNSNFAGETM